MASRSASGGGVRFSALFPNLPNELDNCVDFIKRLTYHSFIQIMGSRRLSSIPVVKRVVKDKGWRLYTVKKDEFVGQRVHAKLVGAMDAIQRMHMKELILVISNNEEDADDALEVFTMQYIYGDEPHVSLVGDDGRRLVEKIKFRGSQYVEEDTYTVLAQIYKLCQVMERLPRNAYCSFRCTFYEGVPEDYVPPGWYESKTLYKFDHEDALDFFSIADMHTPHLASFLSVKSAVILDEVEMREAIENGPSHMIDQTLNNSVDSLEGVPSSKMFHYADSPTTGRTVVVPSGSTPTHRSPDNAGHANQEQAPLLQNLQSENNDRDKPSEGTIVERKSATKLRAGGRKRVENKLVAENQQSSSSDDVSVGRHGRRGAPVQQPLEPVIKKSRTYRIDKITPPTTVLTSPRR